MEEQKDKAKLIQENIESTISNAIKDQNIINYNNPSPSKKREILAKNERRAEAVTSMISDMKEEEAKKELGLEE